MSAALLLEIAGKSFVAAGLVLLALHLLRNRSASERSWIAHVGLVATLLLPLAIMVGPRWAVEAPMPIADMIERQGSPDPRWLPAQRASPVEGPDGAGGTDGEPGLQARLSEEAPLVVYAIPATLLLLLAVLSIIRLRILRRRADVLVDPAWLTALAQAQRRIGIKHGTALLVSGEIASPVSWGVVRPVILIDSETVNARPHAEAIIAHELAHVTRLDWVKLVLGRAATAILWFNPLVWVLARQCHQLREEEADDAVLKSGVGGDDYAALLVGAARQESRTLLLAANGVAPGLGSLKHRVERMLDARLRRQPAAPVWSLTCGAAAILVAAPLAALTPADPPPVLRFAALELQGRGNVILRHGPIQRVRLVRGREDMLRFTADGDRLRIRACVADCPDYEPEIEIITPHIAGVAVQGGGTIQARRGFPAQPLLVAAVSGGGLIHLGGIEAGQVDAKVSGGGTIKTHARNDLDATIRGEGSIVYWGNPAVVSSVRGGGVVVRADDD